MNRNFFRAAVMSLVLCPLMRPQTPDSAVTIRSISAAREDLISTVWGKPGFPLKALPEATILKPSQPEWTRAMNEMGLAGFRGLKTVEKLDFRLPAGNSSVGYLWIARGGLNRLVILHQGHSCKFDFESEGLQAVVKALLTSGYSVATLYMPLPSPCSDGAIIPFHNKLFAEFPSSLPGSALQLFVDPAAETVNYGLQQLKFARVDMVGLSGGGWTTTLYAALDPRIGLSFPVAGTRPRSVPGACGLNSGDREQDAIPSYLNLYVLGSTGAGRKQTQVLNKFDSCCFQVICPREGRPPLNLEQDIRGYEEATRAADAKFGGGNFSVYIDEDSHAHQISSQVVEKVILHALGSP